MSKNKSTEYAELLKEWRRKSHKSQRRLAEGASLNQTYIALLESGKRHPSRGTVLAIARTLDLSVSETNKGLRSIGEGPIRPEDRAIGEIARLEESVKNVIGDVIEELAADPIALPDTVTYLGNVIRNEARRIHLQTGVWMPRIQCGYSGFADTALAAFVAASLRVGSRILSWKDLPERIENKEVTFGIHNPSALLRSDGTTRDLVFCRPALFTFRGHGIFLGKTYLDRQGISLDDRIWEFDWQRKRDLLHKARFSVARGTDLELAVYEALREIQLDFKDIEVMDDDSDVGYSLLLEGKVDAFCGGFNHYYDLEQQGYKPLFSMDQMKVIPVNGIVTHRDNLIRNDKKEERRLLSLFAQLWFWTVKLIDREKDDDSFVASICGQINRSTRGAVTGRTLRAMLPPGGHLLSDPLNKRNEAARIQDYLDAIVSFRRSYASQELALAAGDNRLFPFLPWPELGNGNE